MGKAIAEGIAKQGHKAILISRDKESGLTALESIKINYGEESADLVMGDLSSLRSTRKLAEKLLLKYPRMDILIHNAGIWPTKLIINEDGFESTFMVNYLSNFLLNNLLLDRLKISTPSRIVLVNAGLYPRGNLVLDSTPWGRDFSRFGTYSTSKLCGILYMRKLAEELKGTGVIVNATHPGVIRTGLLSSSGLKNLPIKFIKLFMSDAKKGAKSAIYLALSHDIHTNGCFYDKMENKNLSDKVLDNELKEELWELSKKLCKLD